MFWAFVDVDQRNEWTTVHAVHDMGIIVVYQTFPDLHNQYLRGWNAHTQKVYYDFSW